jgi:methionine-rich copper-binding protein CopC
MWRVLPTTEPAINLKYPALISSIGTLWKELPEPRRAAFTQALIFAGFSGFWTVLPFRLAEPEFDLGAATAGLFGIVGMAGVIAAPIAGQAITISCIGCVDVSCSIAKIFGPDGEVAVGKPHSGNDRNDLIIRVPRDLQPGIYIIYYTAYSPTGQHISGTSAVSVPGPSRLLGPKNAFPSVELYGVRYF